MTSAGGVRYADGVIALSQTDLWSDGYGIGWGQGLSWTNGAGYASRSVNGSGMVNTQQPFLLQTNGGNTLIVVRDGTRADYFDLIGGVWTERYFGQDKLTYNSGSAEYVLTDTQGNVTRFHDFSAGIAATQRGGIKGFTDAGGNVITVVYTGGFITEMTRAATVSGQTITESLLYTYLTTPNANAGLVGTVTLRRKVDAGAYSTVRSVEYTYYGASESFGNLGDLKTAVVKTAAGLVIDTTYYRYYKSGEANGYVHGLKYVVSGDAYDRMTGTLGTNLGAISDSALSAYSDLYLEYDAEHRVAKQRVAGAGGASGQGEYVYSYLTSGNTADMNTWAMKTVEVLPDMTVNTVYTNAFGEVMLTAFTDPSASRTWLWYTQYDSAGRAILEAGPDAVTSYSESYTDLVHFVSNNAEYLSDAAGLVTNYTYAATTTATTSVAGDAFGYLKSIVIRLGELGTAVPQEAFTYIKNTVSTIDFFNLASDTVYRNTNGTGNQTTSYTYTYVPGTNQIASTVVALPTVTTAQNGSNAATSGTAVANGFGRPVWSKDQAGFITYTEYDAATGAVVKTIKDVDTVQTWTFTNLPSGWVTPTGGGLHLVTTYQVDALGRTTKVTYPNGRVDYTVYNDANLEVRYYTGWNSTTNTATGPTTVTRTDRVSRYTETLTMSAAPAVSGGAPTGTEAIAQVQSLSRSYTNEAGQVIYTDAYFNLNGLAYSTSAALGTEGVNFYRTRYGYNAQGLTDRTVTPQGTITRTVYDAMRRPVSVWVGTDDTPSDTNPWSPSNTAGTNLVKVKEYEYDTGLVGASNLTKVAEYPGGGAAARVTQTWYDWRNRAVAVKAGVETTESASVNRQLTYYDYDNLGQVTQVRVYDADTVNPTTTNGVPQPLTAGLLRAKTTTSYDELGRVYRTDTYSVNPTYGTVSTYSLHTDTWYDTRGLVIKTAAPGGVVTKTAYDGAGRVVRKYATDGGGDTVYANAADVLGDTVLTQAEYVYDPSGNVRQVTTWERFHDASGMGALDTPTTGGAARVSYVGYVYDKADRTIAAVNVGTNGGTAWANPGTVPSRSATVLVTSTQYATDAVQVIALTGGPTGGTFTLTFGGNTTAALAYNATAATVQAALAGLASIGAGNVQVSAAGGGGWEVRFIGTKAGTYQSAITANGSGLTGGTAPAASVSTINAGGDVGRTAEVTDAAGRVSRTYADALGRTTRTTVNFVDGVVSDTDDKATGYTYNGAGVTSVIAYLTGGGVQTTGYVYGVTVATGSTIESNEVVRLTQWADPTTGAASASQQESVAINALGQTITTTDRNGTTHALSYDVLGRVVRDEVTAFGAGVYGTDYYGIKRIDTTYDALGNAVLVSSLNSSGYVLNQIGRAYNGLGQLITEYQRSSGAVSGLSLKVQYTYSEMTGGTNNSRLTSVVYPSGYTLSYNYASGLDDSISRLTSISDVSGTLESYDYLGLGTVVRRAHPQPNVDLSYIKRTGESNGDAGDQYTGLDRFGRVVDQRWLNPTTGTATDRFQYGYDQANNRTYRDNLVNAALGEVYSYDALNQLTGYNRGTLNGTKTGVTGTASQSQSWDYDAVGNWDSVTTNGTTQTRTANAQNEITSISGGAVTPTYDNNGNMTKDETGKQYVYDAWNRLVTVKSSTGTVLKTYTYDGLNRRMTETVGSTRTELFNSNQWQVVEEQVGGNTTNRYVWSPVYVNAMILRDRDADGVANNGPEERLWVQQDANWNVTALVNSSGTVVERYLYDPYGNVTVTNASGTTLGSSAYAWVHTFQGMRFDTTSGFLEANQRWYSPTLGRWISLDPIRYSAGDMNLYGFVGNSPGNRTDPSGLVGKPGFWEGIIPVWGSGKEALHSFGEGKILRGLVFTGLAVTDAFLVKSIVTAGGKLVARGVGELASKEALEEGVVKGSLSQLETGAAVWGKSNTPGVRLVKTEGGIWVKEIDPAAGAIARWYGKGTLEAQAQSLSKLDTMAPKFLYRDGRLFIEHVAKPDNVRLSAIYLKGSWKLGSPFNDIRRTNIGAGGKIFDPALHPIHEGLLAGGSLLGLSGVKLADTYWYLVDPPEEPKRSGLGGKRLVSLDPIEDFGPRELVGPVQPPSADDLIIRDSIRLMFGR